MFRIGHNGKGFGAGWHLQEVVIQSHLDGRVWVAECNRWLAKDEDDGQIQRELDVFELPPVPKNDLTASSREPPHKQPKPGTYVSFILTRNLN
jgi:hypothetical protein